MLRRPHPRGAHSCPQDRRRRSGCCSSGDLGRRRHERDHDDHRRFLEARQISWRQRTVLDCRRQAAAIHDRRGQRVLRLRHDPSGICGGRGDPVPVGEADLPSAVVATFCHRVIVPYRPFLHHLCGGDSQPVARQIERSVPMGMSPRWFRDRHTITARPGEHDMRPFARSPGRSSPRAPSQKLRARAHQASPQVRRRTGGRDVAAAQSRLRPP